MKELSPQERAYILGGCDSGGPLSHPDDDDDSSGSGAGVKIATLLTNLCEPTANHRGDLVLSKTIMDFKQKGNGIVQVHGGSCLSPVVEMAFPLLSAQASHAVAGKLPRPLLPIAG